MQAELGEKAVTGVVSMAVSDEGSETHFEAFQVQHMPKLTFLCYAMLCYAMLC